MFNRLMFFRMPIYYSIFRILSIVFIGVWTYRDAKNKNNKDYIIWTIVSMIVPYYLGVLLYILVGRKTSKTLCKNCHRYTDSDKPYCAYCGSEIECKEQEISFKNNNTWAILSVIFLALSIIVPMFITGSNLIFGPRMNYRNYHRNMPEFNMHYRNF